MAERTIDFPDPVYEKLEKRKDRLGLKIADQIRRAVAKEVGEIK